MFDDRDDFFEDSETQELLERYQQMVAMRQPVFFDRYEFDCLIDYFAERYYFKDAIKVIVHAIRQYPADSLLKIKYAQLLIDISRPAKALSIIKSIGKTADDNYELHLAKGAALNLTGKGLEARVAFNNAFRLCDEFKDETAYCIAQSYMQTGHLKLTEKYLLLALQHNPENLLVLYDLGSNYEKMDQPAKGIRYYKKYLEIDPFAEHVWNNLAILYTDTGNIHRAQEAFDYALAINPQFVPACFGKAGLLTSLERYAEAAALYTELLNENNGDVEVLNLLGHCYLQLEDYMEAIGIFGESIKLSGDDSTAWFGIAKAYFGLGKYGLCMDALDKAITSKPDNATYWCMLGEALGQVNHVNKAIDAYTLALLLNPDDRDAKLACAQLFYRKRRYAEAIELLVPLSREEEPGNALVFYRLAAYLVYDKRLDEAKHYFIQGLKLHLHGYQEIFTQFPKTRSIAGFRKLVERHLQKVRLMYNADN